jgi:hypothetical protein
MIYSIIFLLYYAVIGSVSELFYINIILYCSKFETFRIFCPVQIYVMLQLHIELITP